MCVCVPFYPERPNSTNRLRRNMHVLGSTLPPKLGAGISASPVLGPQHTLCSLRDVALLPTYTHIIWYNQCFRLRPMAVCTSTKSAQYVEILGQKGRKQTFWFAELCLKFECWTQRLATATQQCLEQLVQSSEQLQSPMTMLMLSRLQWEVGQAKWSVPAWWLTDYTFGFGYRGCKWRRDRDDIITLY